MLRFSEFKDCWKRAKIEELASVKTGSRDTQNKVDAGRYPFFVRSNTVEKIDTYAFDGEAILTSGDGVGVGKNIHYINAKFDYHQRVYAIHSFSKDLYGKFFYQFFRENFLRRVMRLSAKNSVDSVRMSMITDMEVPHPNIEEQQKIADFLGAVDEKIAQLEKKKDLLEDYKKGCKQKLLSQDIRFTDDNGNPFPDWKPCKLKEHAKIYDGTHQTPKYVPSGVPFYSVEHVTSNDFTITKYVSEDVYLKECERVRIERGDILLTRIGSIGVSRLVDWDVRASFYVSLALLKLSSTLVPVYMNQFIKSDFFQRELWHRTIHVAFPQKINLGEIGECLIKLPCMAEQQLIGEFLSSLDDKISLVANELDKAKTFKKGLLQQMFV